MTWALSLSLSRSDLLSSSRGSGASIGGFGAYHSEDSFEGATTSPFASLASAHAALPPQPSSLRTAKYSMSMSSLSTVANNYPTTSSTYEQYFSNIDESGEDDQGGIFF